MFSKMRQNPKVQVVGQGKRSIHPQDTYKWVTGTAALSRGKNVTRL